MLSEIKTLEEYLSHYGRRLADQAERSLQPLHVPGRDPCRIAGMGRQPFEAQAHVIAAGARALDRQRGLCVIGETGSGKTIMGMGIVHTHAAKQGRAAYRALVFAPGHLTKKWQRELEETIGGVKVYQLEEWTDPLELRRKWQGHGRPDGGLFWRLWSEPKGPEWYVIGRDRAKLGAKWRPAFVRRRRMGEDFLRCPKCGAALTRGNGEEEGLFLDEEDLARRQHKCVTCKAPLYQYTGEINRYEPAKYIHKHLKGFFQYLIVDEAHEEKSATSAQANAAGALVAACGKTLFLTGTFSGGLAEHLRPLLMRLCPTSLVREGFTWSSVTPFNECYGRIETTVTEKEGRDDGDSNSQSRGKTRRVNKKIVPGVMPTLFGRHLMGNAVFLGLDEVAADLPPFAERVVGCPLGDLEEEYRRIEDIMRKALADMVRKGDRRFLGAFLMTLLGYPDLPYGWGEVGYKDGNVWVPVVCPKDRPAGAIYPKERVLHQVVREQRDRGRRVWVYTTMTDKHDVLGRLQGQLTDLRLRVGVLRSSVKNTDREDWIARNGPKYDVILSHPQLVQTGLDFFSKSGAYNFPSLVFYQTGYNPFVLRQASRRAWRIGQKLPCEVHYLYYEGTMQARAMALMGRKLTAAQALEGKFSSEGLAAMAGDDGMEMALARSLAENIDEGDPTRTWQKVGATGAQGRDMNVDEFVEQIDDILGQLWLPGMEEAAAGRCFQLVTEGAA